MNNFRALSLAFACAAALFAAPAAEAASMVLCSPPVSGSLPGPQRVVNPNSGGGTYSLNNRGCAVMALADIGYFQSQGYTQGGNVNSIVFNTGVVASGTTDFVVGNLPAGAFIDNIVYSNAIAAAVTGGVSIGSTANGTDIVVAQAVASSGVGAVAAASILKQAYSLTTATAIHLAAVTSWNGANVTVTITYSFF